MASRTLLSVNLNHLVALDALLAEGSVTRAAQQVGVSQSALSHTLSALRDIFEDPLLIRGREGMVLSERAEQLSGPLRRALTELEGLFRAGTDFDPSATGREFRLATADFIGARVVALLIPVFAAQAPQAQLTVRPLSLGTAHEDLERGDVDAVIGPRLSGASSIESEAWREEQFVCVVRGDHPALGGTFDLETFAHLGHVMVSPSGSGTGWVDQALAERGLSRRVVLRVASFLMAPIIVAGSDLVLTAPQSVVEPFVGPFKLHQVQVPVELAPLPLMLSWHQRSTNDAGQQWFRGLLSSCG